MTGRVTQNAGSGLGARQNPRAHCASPWPLYCPGMAARPNPQKRMPEPIEISPRFTLKVFAKPQTENSPKSGGPLTALQVVFDGSYEPSVVATMGASLTVRLTDLTTGRTVDDEVGPWNAQVEADFNRAADTLRQMQEADILRTFFGEP